MTARPAASPPPTETPGTVGTSQRVDRMHMNDEPWTPLSPPGVAQVSNSTTFSPSVTDSAHVPMYNGHTLEALKDSVGHLDKEYECVKVLLCMLFSAEYILSHSVSGKASNSKTERKPPYDSRLYGAMVTALKSKFPNIKYKVITEKVHSVQKWISKQPK